MIQADENVYCQWPFRRQIEVLKQEKDVTHHTTIPFLKKLNNNIS